MRQKYHTVYAFSDSAKHRNKREKERSEKRYPLYARLRLCENAKFGRTEGRQAVDNRMRHCLIFKCKNWIYSYRWLFRGTCMPSLMRASRLVWSRTQRYIYSSSSDQLRIEIPRTENDATHTFHRRVELLRRPRYQYYAEYKRVGDVTISLTGWKKDRFESKICQRSRSVTFYKKVTSVWFVISSCIVLKRFSQDFPDKLDRISTNRSVHDYKLDSIAQRGERADWGETWIRIVHL